MRAKILIICAALLLGLAWPAEAPGQEKKAPAGKPAASARKAPARRAVRRRAPARRAPAPANQRVPTRDRYAEIQQALADAGHFTGAPDGLWKQESMDALKAFQAEQGFEPTGKIDARSLIRLGLGPQYETVTSESAAPPPDAGARRPG